MLPGDRLVCAFITPQKIGTTFKDWFLHVTIVPWFRLETESGVIARDLATKLSSVRTFSVSMGQANVGFGYQKGKMATLVQLPTPLVKIERSVRDYLQEQKAWLVDATTKQTRTFKPHVTDQKSGSLNEGDVFTCDRLYIIEQKGGYKEIVGEVPLAKVIPAKAGIQ